MLAGAFLPAGSSMNEQPDDAIATRTLEVDGVPCFHLRVFKPEPEDGGAHWRCRYLIDGPMTRHAGSACAPDAMQALLHVIHALGTEAEVSQENQAGLLTFRGQSAHFGFPPLSADPGQAELRRLQGLDPA